MKKWFLLALTSLLLAAGALFFTVLPNWVDQRINTRGPLPDYDIPTLHSNLFIADMHADTLLWNRPLLNRSNYGHVDLPRLQQGNVAFQIFSAVTRVPFGQNFQSNKGDSDKIMPLVVAQRWPAESWNSPLQRALFQARRLKEAAAESNGELRIIQNRADLFALHFNRVYEPSLVGAMLAIEGAQALEGSLDNIDTLYNAGYRMIGLSHFYDTSFGGSAHGVNKGGLSTLGHQLVERMIEKRMMIDIAHASPALINDLLNNYRAPLFVSHTGVKGTCNSPRNLSDEHLRQIAHSGGLIGISFFPGAVCGRDVDHIVKAIRHASNVAGVDAIALGSDFDGAVYTPFDASRLSVLTKALLEADFKEREVQKIMGGNMLRAFVQALPANPEPVDAADYTF